MHFGSIWAFFIKCQHLWRFFVLNQQYFVEVEGHKHDLSDIPIERNRTALNQAISVAIHDSVLMQQGDHQIRHVNVTELVSIYGRVHRLAATKFD